MKVKVGKRSAKIRFVKDSVISYLEPLNTDVDVKKGKVIEKVKIDSIDLNEKTMMVYCKEPHKENRGSVFEVTPIRIPLDCFKVV